MPVQSREHEGDEKHHHGNEEYETDTCEPVAHYALHHPSHSGTRNTAE